MKISTKGEYGIRALLELSHRYTEGYVQSADIAQARSIPGNYLYQLLITLRKAGIIRSRRGPQGGHMLARAPESICLAEVLIALEGPLEPTTCIQKALIHDCPFGDGCAVRDVWQRIADETERILRETNFRDLSRDEAFKRQAAGAGVVALA